MKLSRLVPVILTSSAFFLAACAGQQNPAGVKVVQGDEETKTLIYSFAGYDPRLLDENFQCRIWAYGWRGGNIRPCVDWAPSCGAPIDYADVKVVDTRSSKGADVVGYDALVESDLVTSGFLWVPIKTTRLEAERQLARRVAQAGCDLLVVGSSEWITIRGFGVDETFRLSA